MNARKVALEQVFSRLCGFAVEVTVRKDNEFTLSAEGNRTFGRAIGYLRESKRVLSAETSYDEECDYTCCYLTVA